MTTPIQIIFDDEQAKALRKFCREHKLTLSSYVRDTLMLRIGRKDLVGAVKSGRPKSDQ